MQISDLIFEVRDASFNRVAQLNPGIDGLTTFRATTRLNNVGSWELTIPETVPDAALLSAPGAGIVVTGPNGVLFSGPVVSATNTRESGSPIGEWSIKGATDTIILGEHLAYPTPSTADVTHQIQAYDSASGKASTVMYGYVDRNLISGATARKVTGLSLATDTALGSNVSFSARFQTLGELLTTIANVSNPVLGFDVKQVGTGLVFSVYQPSDKSKTIRMSTETGTLSHVSYGYGYGKTRAIVGGMGQLTSRQFVEVTTSGSTAAEATWSRRVEVFVDQNNESDATKLAQAGTDALADQGNITSIEVVPTSDSTMEYGVDWGLGDTVTVVIGGQEISAIVSQATMTVSEDGVRVGATVGQPSGFDFDSILMKRQVDQSSDISTLQLKETGGTATLVPAGGSTGQALVKTANTDYATGWGAISGVPTGAISQFAGATAPSGYLLCNGATFDSGVYPALAAVVGDLYGTHSGTTYYLPDLRSRVPVGLDSRDSWFNALGLTGGEKTHLLTAAESGIPAHNHGITITDPGHNHTQNPHRHTYAYGNGVGDGSGLQYSGTAGTQSQQFGIKDTTATNNASTTGITASSSNNTAAPAASAHNIMQPYLVMNYIIKT